MPFKMYDEYSVWKKNQAAILTSFRGKDVSVLFSGGKDSSLSLHFLLTASDDFGFRIQVYAITFPKHRYAISEVDRIDAFWKKRGLSIQWYETGMSDNSLETADNPCIVCIRARKQLLYEAIRSRCEDLNSLVLVTGYTLSDIVSYSLEYLMGGIYTHPDGEEMQRSQKRFMETGQRFYPILKMEGGYSIYRPILQYNTQDVARIIQEASVPILSVPCNYARFRPKRILESYYEFMRLRFDYKNVVDFAKECLALPSTSEYGARSKEYFLKQKFY